MKFSAVKFARAKVAVGLLILTNVVTIKLEVWFLRIDTGLNEQH